MEDSVNSQSRNNKESSKRKNTLGCAWQLLDYIAVLRPTLLFPVWTLVLLGHYRSSAHAFHSLKIGNLGLEIPVNLSLNPRVWTTLGLYSMLSGAAYIINQISDRKTDRANNKLYLVANGYVKLPLVKLEASLLCFGSIVWAITQFHHNTGYLSLIAISLALGWIYSMPPIRLKARPVLDLLANAIGYGCIAFLIGWTTTSTLDPDALQQAIPYVFCVGAAFVNTTLPDIKGDQAHGDLTIGILLGLKRSCQLSLVLLGLAISSAWLLQDMIVFITSVICFPFFLYMNIKPTRRIIILATRVGILVLSLITCMVIPLYFVLFVTALLSVRWYYGIRFGIAYPSPKA